MEKLVYLDTHVVVWLYLKELNLFPSTVLTLLDTKQLTISPIILLELQYLHEIGRLKVGGEKIYSSLHKSIGLTTSSENFCDIIQYALKQSWTRDPFDRIIVAQAALNSSSLISRDETIRKHYQHAIWR